jgi:dTDP-4-dehydrorhamnose reductase
MNILLLGKTGQVGFELHRTLATLGTITAPGREELDLTNEQAVASYLGQHRPNLIVNAAAWTAVDAAEAHQVEAERLNTDLPKQLAEYAATNKGRLVHYSSDYVYPGNGTTPWQEASPTGPLSHYGKTKLKGDQAVEQSGADHLIFRTSWVYSARGNNFMKTMLRLAESKTALNIVADQIGTPTPARLIAQVTALAIHSKLETGLYHLAPTAETSWQGFAKEIFRLAGKNTKANPISTSDYPTPATRPLNSRMDVTKLEQALKVRLPAWQSQLELTLSEYLEQ